MGRFTSLIAAIALCPCFAGCAATVSGSGAGSASPSEHTVTVTAAPPTPSTAPSTSQAPTFSTLFASGRSGVVRIEVVGCSDSGIGTGFLLSPWLVATVAHVVAQSVVVSLVDGSQHTTGSVIGIDQARDLALVRSSAPIRGYHFRLASSLPAVGDPVAAVGFPIGDPITLTQGHISGLHRRITVDGSPRSNMIETDTAINPGNSGGPLLNEQGEVVGLVDAKNIDAEGIGYAVPATEAAPEYAQWRHGNPQPAANCSNPLGPGQTSATVPAPGNIGPGAARGIASTFEAYFDGINSGDYATAYAQLNPRNHLADGEAAFAEADSTSYDSDFRVLNAERMSGHSAKVGLAFTSIQRADKGPNGDTCDRWRLEYTMVRIAGYWYIDSAAPYDGASNHTPC